jgi:hypothetical protein
MGKFSRIQEGLSRKTVCLSVGYPFFIIVAQISTPFQKTARTAIDSLVSYAFLLIDLEDLQNSPSVLLARRAPLEISQMEPLVPSSRVNYSNQTKQK